MPQTLYPRATLKKIIKAHAARPLSKNVDILVRLSLPPFYFLVSLLLETNLLAPQIYLNYALFMQEYVYLHIAYPRNRVDGVSERIGAEMEQMRDWDARLTERYRLINEASIKSKQSGERGISARSVRKVGERTLRKYKG
jgi:hypothetical protein